MHVIALRRVFRLVMDSLSDNPDLVRQLEPLPLESFSVSGLNPKYQSRESKGLRIVLGETQLGYREAMRIRQESVIVLDEQVDAPIKIFFGNALVAYGNLVSVDNQICVHITHRVESIE